MEIKSRYTHSKFGTIMFNLCAKGTKFLVKHKGLYFLLACTGGIIMTLLGLIITAVLAFVKIFDKTITFKKYNGIYLIEAGPQSGGGFEMGLMFVRDHKSLSSHVNPHEFGHTMQNCLLGVFFPILVAIPSACRYGARKIGKNKNGKPYDAAGFEDSATQCGKYADGYLNLSDEEKKNVN